MLNFQKEELTPEAQYKLLSGSIVPRPIAWVSTLSKDSKVINLAPFSLFSIVSKELPLVSLSIMREKGQQKDTAYHLSQTGQAVIQLVGQEMLEEMNQSSASFRRDESEVSHLGLATIASQRVSVPGIAKAKVRYETTVYQHIPIYNKEGSEIITDLFILEVVVFHLEEEVYDQSTGYINVQTLNPIARLAGPQYGEIGKTYELGRPK